MGHDLDYLLHGRTLRGVFRPAARHQALNRLRQVFDQRRSCSWQTGRNKQKEKLCLNADNLQAGEHSSTFSLLLSWAAWHFPHWQTKGSLLLVLTIMDSPHNAKSWSSNFIKGLFASDHFPQNYTPAEHIALLTIIATCKYKTDKKRLFQMRKNIDGFSPDAHSR